MEKNISTRSTKKDSMMVSFKLRLSHVFGKNMTHILALCRILRIIKSNFSKNAPNVWVYEIAYMSCITYVKTPEKKFLNINPKVCVNLFVIIL